MTAPRHVRIPAAFAILSAVGCGLVMVGCNPSVERICDRRIELVEREFGLIDRNDPKPRREAVRRCMTEMTDLKKANPARFKCESTCILDHKHLTDVPDCMKKLCPDIAPTEPSPPPSTSMSVISF